MFRDGFEGDMGFETLSPCIGFVSAESSCASLCACARVASGMGMDAGSDAGVSLVAAVTDREKHRVGCSYALKPVKRCFAGAAARFNAMSDVLCRME